MGALVGATLERDDATARSTPVAPPPRRAATRTREGRSVAPTPAVHPVLGPSVRSSWAGRPGSTARCTSDRRTLAIGPPGQSPEFGTDGGGRPRHGRLQQQVEPTLAKPLLATCPPVDPLTCSDVALPGCQRQPRRVVRLCADDIMVEADQESGCAADCGLAARSAPTSGSGHRTDAATLSRRPPGKSSGHRPASTA